MARALAGGSTGRVGSGERGGARDGAEEVGGAGCVSKKIGVGVGLISVGFFMAAPRAACLSGPIHHATSGLAGSWQVEILSSMVKNIRRK
jgi:hypothetical protein